MSRPLNRRKAVVTGGAICLALALGGCESVSEPTGVYVSDLMSAPRWIAATSGAPAWSPDGTLLAWGDEDGLRVWKGFSKEILDASNSEVAGRSTWSPDSTSLAFIDLGERVLKRFDLKTGKLRILARLDQGQDNAIRSPVVVRGGPAWSPDGDRIAFICWDGYGDELCLVGDDGSARQQLTTLGVVDEEHGGAARSSVTGMAWSPDGNALAVSVQAEQKGATAGIFRVELASRSGTRVSKMVAGSPLVWDGPTDDLIFSASVEGRTDVYRLPSGGGKPEALTSALRDGGREPALSGNTGLAVVSGSRIAIFQDGSVGAVYIEAPGLVASAPAYRPGAEQIAFLGGRRPIQRYP